MIINIEKESWETAKSIKIWSAEKQIWLSLEEKLRRLKFNEDQVNFLHDMFVKLANMKITA